MRRTVTCHGPGTTEAGGVGRPIREIVVTIAAGVVELRPRHGGGLAVVEVLEVEGLPIQVVWEDSRLAVEQHRGVSSLAGALARTISGRGRVRAHVAVSASAATRVVVRTLAATTSVTGLSADVELSTGSGEVLLEQLTGRVHVRSGTGDVTGRGLTGDLRVSTGSGRLRLAAGKPRSVRITTVTGHAELDVLPGSCIVSMESVAADLRVQATGCTGFDVTADSASGQVVVDGKPLLMTHTGTPSGHVADGDQSLVVRAKTMRGNVLVDRRGQPTTG